MTPRFSKFFAVSLLALATLMFALPAPAQGTTGASSPPTVVTLQLTVPETLTITTSAPGGIAALASSGGGNYSAPAFNVTSTWSVASTRTQLNACSYLSTGTLPGTHMNYQESVGGGAPIVFNNTGSTQCNAYLSANTGLGLGWNGPDVFAVGISSSNLSGTNTTSVQISTTGLTGTVPAGTTSGVLNYILIVN